MARWRMTSCRQKCPPWSGRQEWHKRNQTNLGRFHRDIASTGGSMRVVEVVIIMVVERKRKKKRMLVSDAGGHVGSGVGRRSQTHPAYLPKDYGSDLRHCQVCVGLGPTLSVPARKPRHQTNQGGTPACRRELCLPNTQTQSSTPHHCGWCTGIACSGIFPPEPVSDGDVS